MVCVVLSLAVFFLLKFHIYIGLVTATFAASLITSPAIGAHLARLYSDNFIIALGLCLIGICN
jgi:hypothetical protein